MERARIDIAREYANEIRSRAALPELTPRLKEVAASGAKSSHEGWMAGKAAKGYIYGPVTNDDREAGPLTNPYMVPWEALDEETKLANFRNAESVVKLMQSELKVEFVSFSGIVRTLAEKIHDEWCRFKLENGWVWGPVTDPAQKTHRDLIPFGEMLNDPELIGDCDPDIDTAKSFIITMIQGVDIFPVFRVTEE